MTEPDDRDLAAAFEALSAPPSTASYATRTTGLEVPSASRRWPQVLASALAVLVAVAGAGTFLALRSAREGTGGAGSGGTPAARSGAAMAYDSTDRVTVMFGGDGASGHALTDTWTWDGSAWHSAAAGPGPLVSARMVDDPADRGVLLIGTPVTGGGGGVAGSGSGCAVSSAPAVTSTATTAAPQGVTAPGHALLTPPPGNQGPGVPATATPNPVAPTTPPTAASCPSVPPPSTSTVTEQTWLFFAGHWTRVGASSDAEAPPAGAQLAVDPASGQVVAVAGAYSCGPPVEAPANDAIVCPEIGVNPAASGVSGPFACPPDVYPDAACGEGISTWMWSRDDWTSDRAATVAETGTTLLFTDPVTGHATLMSQDGLALSSGLYCSGSQGGTLHTSCPLPICPVNAKCATPTVTTWSWWGSTWRQVSHVTNIQPAPELSGASVATVSGHIVVLTSDGQTWTWAAGQWVQSSAAGHPAARFGAAMAEGPGGTVVLFGGEVSEAVAAPVTAHQCGGCVVSSRGPTLGSDTWTWNGHAWRHVAGRVPSPPSVACPTGANGSVPPCAPVPLPAQVAPGGTPHPSATGGSSGSAGASPSP